MAVYDPCPVVTYESNIASYFDVRYILKIDKRVGALWVTQATIKRYPNAESCGVFDMGPVLRNAIEETMSTKAPAVGKVATDAGVSAQFRIQVGYEYKTTADGNILLFPYVNRYIRGVLGRHLDQFTAWSRRPMTDFVMSTAQDGKFMTLREVDHDSITLMQTAWPDAIVIPVHESERFMVSYLSTDVASEFDTPAMKLSVSWGSQTGLLGSNSVNISNQEVSNVTFYGDDSDGVVLRNLHVGPKDLLDATWASGFTSAATWNYIAVRMEQQSDSRKVSQTIVFKNRECQHQGIKFLFLNNLGGWDTLHCEGHTSRNIKYTRKQYTSTTGNWATATGINDAQDLRLNDPQGRMTKSDVTSEKQVHKTQTGYLDSKHNELVHGLMRSKRVLATKFDKPRQDSDNDYYPVNITSTMMKSMFREVDKLIEYTIEFEYANELRPTI